MRVLAIGECMAELAPSHRDGDFSLGFAGDTFNTAWYLAQIAPELDMQYLTAVGDDRLSDQMLDFMARSQIGTTHVARRPGETIGLYMIHLEDGERNFSYWRGQSAARQLASDISALNRGMASADVIYFSGITLAILSAQARVTFLDAVRAHRALGKTLVFDSNLRPRLWPNPDEMKETVQHAAACADIVLPSFEDEAAWFGDSNSTATLDRYTELGANLVIVKNGDGPVEFHDHGERGSVVVDPVCDVIDSTAAGDSFNAGVLAGLLQGKSLRAGIEFGCSIAGQVVAGKGALVPVKAPAN